MFIPKNWGLGGHGSFPWAAWSPQTCCGGSWFRSIFKTSGLTVSKHIVCVVCCSQDALVPPPRDPSLSSPPGGLLLHEGPQASSSADSFDSRGHVPRVGKQLVLMLSVTAFCKTKDKNTNSPSLCPGLRQQSLP